MFDRCAPRDLFDVFQLSLGSLLYDTVKFQKVGILFGITCDEDWRKKDSRMIEEISTKMINEQLNPL